jgi:hypothetical protein
MSGSGPSMRPVPPALGRDALLHLRFRMLAVSTIEDGNLRNDFEATDQRHRLLTVQADGRGGLILAHDDGPGR